jgi:tetratricopeptide (TPR) repeat protein
MSVASGADLDKELEARAQRLRDRDPVGAARAYFELGVFRERTTSDRQAALRAYDSARSLSRSFQPVLMRLRRLLKDSGESARARLTETIDEELAVTELPERKADLLGERARAQAASGRLGEARESYAQALRLVPRHAASLRGLEIILRRALAVQGEPSLAAQLASHLDRAATAYMASPDRADGDAPLAAWLQVERARILDRVLGKPTEARTALEQAVSLEPEPGPVRASFNRYLVRHRDAAGLASSLGAEASLEKDDDRAARLLYTSARILTEQQGGPQQAGTRGGVEASEIIRLLRTAAKRAPAQTATAHRALDELVYLFEHAGETELAVATHEQRLSGLIADASTPVEAVAHEHVRLSMLETALGHVDRAAKHAERALALNPESDRARRRLDGLLTQLQRHEERLRLWEAEGNAPREIPVRVRALLRAAEIAQGELGRKDEALSQLRAAWVIAPGNPEVFDALSALLAPTARDPDDAGRGVRERVELYTLAAAASTERTRKIALYEKLASIWEDELGLPARAIEESERILALDGRHRSALLSIARNAARAADYPKLARALTTEAEIADTPEEKRRLYLRAASVWTEKGGDLGRALVLVERALPLDPNDTEGLAAHFQLLQRTGRAGEARRALELLVQREKGDARRFELLVDGALIDEQQLHRPHDAVAAYLRSSILATPCLHGRSRGSSGQERSRNPLSMR